MSTSWFGPLGLPRVLAAAAGLALLALAAAGAAAARPAHAVSDITVDTAQDGPLATGAKTCVSDPTSPAHGKCSLRAAIGLNEASGGGSTITLKVGGASIPPIVVGSALAISHDVTIQSGGAGEGAINGTGVDRVVDIAAGANVVMTGLLIAGGSAPADAGGGIRNAGHLTLNKVQVTGNHAAFGGGIADMGTLVLNAGTVVDGNGAAVGNLPQGVTGGGIGGGIAEYGTLTATGATLASNQAEIGGDLAISFLVDQAGHIVQVGSATVDGSEITNGSAVDGGGAALDLGAHATFTRTTFANNVAPSSQNTGQSLGGAIASDCGTLALVNDTLAANRATDGFGGAIGQVCGSIGDSAAHISTPGLASHPHAGPSVRHESITIPTVATASLDFVTAAGNAGGTVGGQSLGAIVVLGTNNVFTVHDTILANGANGLNCFVGGAPITTMTSQGYNLADAKDCPFSATGDQSGVDPKLGALANNPAPPRTMALPAGSPAVDSADPNCDVKTDERGVSRPQPQGGRCDIGAFELEQATPAPAASPTPTPLPAPPVTGTGPAPADPSRIALILALLALPLVGAGLLIARRRTA